jgi:hypothetical protein
LAQGPLLERPVALAAQLVSLREAFGADRAHVRVSRRRCTSPTAAASAS